MVGNIEKETNLMIDSTLSIENPNMFNVNYENFKTIFPSIELWRIVAFVILAGLRRDCVESKKYLTTSLMD